MSKKLAAKASLIQLPPEVAARPAAPASADGEPGVAPGSAAMPPLPTRTEPSEMRAKTAPGSMAVFMASQSAAVKEAEELRERLKAFDGAFPVRALDPQTIRPSRWANRHEHSFSDAAFAELKADIAAAGTNIQPVSVRRLAGVLNRSTPPGAADYELVFGHRRHRACLELGLPVQAMVTELSDVQLFEAMERENRARKNLSAWEQGRMYKRALDEGLYPSQRRLSEALGVDVSLVSKSLSLARLPDAVVGAFASPLEIQFRWAQPLAEALQKDPDGVLARATRLKQSGVAVPAAQVLAMLVGEGAGASRAGAGGEPGQDLLNRSTPPAPGNPQVLTGPGGQRAVLTRDVRGGVTVKFEPGLLTEAAQAALLVYVDKLVNRR